MFVFNLEKIIENTKIKTVIATGLGELVNLPP